MTEQQAAPEQADLRQRTATAASGHWMKLPNEDGYSVCGCGSIVRYDRHHAAFKLHVADTVLAVVEPELAALRGQLDARPGCPDPIECDHEAAVGQLREQVVAAQAENERLRAEQAMAVSVARAAGYRLAADNAAEQRQLHGHDCDAEMLVFVLQQVAGLHERAATDPAFIAATTPPA